MVDSDGQVSLAVQLPLETPYHLLESPEVSGDVLAYTARFYCDPLVTCRVEEPRRGVIAAGGQEETEYIGRVRISRDGRYVLRHSYRYFGPSGQIELTDRLTGAAISIPVADFVPLAGGRLVSSRGAALVYSGGLWLIRIDGSSDYLPTFNFGPFESEPYLYGGAAGRDGRRRNDGRLSD